jgi:hypothetical protein
MSVCSSIELNALVHQDHCSYGFPIRCHDLDGAVQHNGNGAAPSFDQASCGPQQDHHWEAQNDLGVIRFYSGNLLHGSVTGLSGKPYQKYAGFCLETQHFPDSPNHPNFPDTTLEPGHTYHSETVFVFGTIA